MVKLSDLPKPGNLPEPAGRILELLFHGIEAIKPGWIEGVYITGSIALNDFHLDKSDIDFVILCEYVPDEETLCRLKKLHKEIKNEFIKPELNGCYISRETLSLPQPAKAKFVSVHEGRLFFEESGVGPILLTELKTTAITLYGISADKLTICEHEPINSFLFKNINSYWRNWIDRHSLLSKRKLLLILIPRLCEWAILGVARQLYTLEKGTITSKTKAGYHCLKLAPDKYHGIIKEAIVIRLKRSRNSFFIINGYDIAPSFKRAQQTIDCVDFIINLFNSTYLKSINHDGSQLNLRLN